MKGLILTAGRNTRPGDLSDRHNKTPLDPGGETLLGNLLNHFASAGIRETDVVVTTGDHPVALTRARQLFAQQASKMTG